MKNTWENGPGASPLSVGAILFHLWAIWLKNTICRSICASLPFPADTNATPLLHWTYVVTSRRQTKSIVYKVDDRYSTQVKRMTQATQVLSKTAKDTGDSLQKALNVKDSAQRAAGNLKSVSQQIAAANTAGSGLSTTLGKLIQTGGVAIVKRQSLYRSLRKSYGSWKKPDPPAMPEKSSPEPACSPHSRHTGS